MPKLDVATILRQQLKEVRASASRLDEAIRILERLGSKGRGRSAGRKMSAEGRARIAAAQRKRWAKLRRGKK
jgi:predicted phage gp36 major capsid-like protein